MSAIIERTRSWWHEAKDGGDPGSIMMGQITRLKNDQTGRYTNFRHLATAFEYGINKAFQSGSTVDDLKNLLSEELAPNHARSAIETVHAKLLKAKNSPMPITTGGNREDRENAKRFGKALDGALSANNIDEIKAFVYFDALIHGLGVAKVEHGLPKLEIVHVPVEDIVLDEAECRYRKPRQVYQRMFMDRDVLLEKYGEAGEDFYSTKLYRTEAIASAGQSIDWQQQGRHDNQVEVWMGYHLKSGPDAKDGFYVVMVDGKTLEVCAWDRDTLPFIWLVLYPRLRQLHGLSMLADILPLQKEHNKITNRLQLAVHRMGAAHIYVATEAAIEPESINNSQGGIVPYSAAALGGQDPVKVLAPNFASPQLLEYRTGLIGEMITGKGISSMTMTGGTPEGLKDASGKALELSEENTAERLFLPHQACEHFSVNLAWRIVEEAEDIVDENPEYTSNYRALGYREKRALEKIRWKDVLQARDSYEIIVFSVGDLAKSPAAKFQQLQIMAQAGQISAEQFKRLFQIPDLEAELDIDASDVEIVDKVLDAIVLQGKVIMPEEFDALDICLTRGRKYYNNARVNDVPEEKLQGLRDYLARAKFLSDKAKALNAPQNQGMPAQGAAPAPGPAPVGA